MGPVKLSVRALVEFVLRCGDIDARAQAGGDDRANEGARIASFVSVAPIDDPKVAVLVCLDEPHSWTTSGGALSGPVCAEVLGKVLPYLGVERESGE